MSSSMMAPVAVVVGGSRGIGLAISNNLLKSGYRVGVLSRSPPLQIIQNVSSSLRGSELIHQTCDVRQGHKHIAEAMNQLHKSLMGSPSVFVYAAGIRGPDSLIASGAQLDEL
jgi:NAD(P)-dependent dehydrogenase (short-subunit alcohol dehydrogenase family)